MMSPRKSLGVMRPLGGGDPIPLKKEEMLIGRRPTSDIRLDFENISGKHCVLKYVRGTWHVRDLGSTNGTTINGQKITSEHGVMPNDELGVAGHFYMLDYDPSAPTSLMDTNQMLDEEMGNAPPKHKSLMELAGLEDPDSPRTKKSRPQAPPQKIHRADPNLQGFEDPDGVPDTAVDEKVANVSDDDFFDMIQGDVWEDKPKPGR